MFDGFYGTHRIRLIRLDGSEECFYAYVEHRPDDDEFRDHVFIRQINFLGSTDCDLRVGD